MLATALSFIFLILHITEKNGFPPPLGQEEEEKYTERLTAGDREARRVLIEHNLRLVAHIVKKYYSTCDEQDDLISIGTIGLIKAVDSFRGDKRVRISTYASKCIRNEILMYFRAKKKTSAEVSLNEEIDTDKDGNSLMLTDILTADAEGEDDILDSICTRARKDALEKAVAEKLDEREKELIRLRYGLGTPPLTQKMTAEKLNISRSYVSRIEKAAIEKLRDALAGCE